MTNYYNIFTVPTVEVRILKSMSMFFIEIVQFVTSAIKFVHHFYSVAAQIQHSSFFHRCEEIVLNCVLNHICI